MRKIIYLLFIIIPLISQSTTFEYNNLDEPEWIGEGVIIIDTFKTIPLEKSIADVKIKEQLIGPTKKLYIKGRRSPVRVQEGTINIIFRVENNNIDPMSVIRIFKFSGKKNRDAIISQFNEITGTISYNKFKKIDFSAKRFGNNSYLLTIKNLEPGEYGISVGDPDDNKTLVVSSFGVDKEDN